MADLESIAVSLSDEERIERLLRWYDEILSGGYDFVVFVARRSYMLALMLQKMQDQDKEMEDKSESVILTDASLYLHCEDFARLYCESGRFPSICVCEDILLYGKGMNHLLESVEQRLCALLSDYPQEEIEQAFEDAVQLREYARGSRSLLLYGKYDKNNVFEEILTLAQLHQLSYSLSSLLLCSDIANECYVPSLGLSDEQYNSLDLSSFKESSYHNIKEKTEIKILSDGDKIKAIYTLRIIKNRYIEGYRVVPFVFLPNLNERETELLLQGMADKVGSKGEAVINWLYELKQIEGKRSFNELITLVLSSAFLQEFLEKEHLYFNDKREIRKLARNYNQKGLPETEKILTDIINNKLFSQVDLEDALAHSIDGSNFILKTGTFADTDLQSNDISEIRDKVEHYFYEWSCEEEKRMFAVSHNPFFPDAARDERSLKTTPVVLRDLFTYNSPEKLGYGICWILQLMDIGAVAISSYPSKDSFVEGVCQYAKTGEISLFIDPVRYYKYIPMLLRMRLRCRQEGRNMEEEMDRFKDSIELKMSFHNDEYNIITEQWEALKGFLGKLSEIGQTLEDWNCIFLRWLDFTYDCSAENVEADMQLNRFMISQAKCLRAYESYLEKGDR